MTEQENLLNEYHKYLQDNLNLDLNTIWVSEFLGTPKCPNKEKAEELVKLFACGRYETSKRNALICAEQISLSDWFMPDRENYALWNNYWKKVKQEIEKL